MNARNHLDAANALVPLIERRKGVSFSIEALQAIFSQEKPEKFLEIFSKLVFHGVDEELLEQEIVLCITDFTKQLDVDWQETQSEGSTHRGRPRFAQRQYSVKLMRPSKLRVHEESKNLLQMQVNLFIQTACKLKQKVTAHSVLRHFAPQLLRCLFIYMTKDGYEKTQILARLRWLIKEYSDEANWAADVRKRCRAVIGNRTTMTKEEFKKVFNLQEFIANRLYALADENNDGDVDIQELFAVTTLILRGDRNEKLKFFFSIYDENGNGTLDKAELADALASCIKESKLQMEPGKTERLAEMLFSRAKTTSGQKSSVDSLSFDELVSLMKEYPTIYENLSISTFDSVMPSSAGKRWDIKGHWNSVRNHAEMYARLWIFIALLSAVVLAIGIERLYQQITAMADWVDTPLVIAKTCGQLLNFLLSLLLLYTLKHRITWLKSTWLRHYFPLDDAIFLHKATAITAFLIGVIHALSHVVLIAFKIKFHKEPVNFLINDWETGRIYISGFLLTIFSLAISILSSPPVRQKSHGLFLITHYVMGFLWYTALFFHAKNFIYWVLAPMALFIMERAQFAYNILKNRAIVQLAATHDNTTFLSIQKPPNMTWKPGDYAYINIPAVSKTRWRPFTISSGQEDQITFHIRKVGAWTGDIYRMVKELETAKQNSGKVRWAYKSNFWLNDIECGISEAEGDTKTPDSNRDDQTAGQTELKMKKLASKQISVIVPLRGEPVKTNWRIYMNGPFSTPSYDILNTEHSILVAGGIGVTPFASVLESVVLQLKERSKICPCGCGYRVWFDSGSRLKRIDFFWLTRSLDSLGLFLETFRELETEQHELGLDPPLVNVHLYLTGLMKENDMRGTFLQLALNTAYDEKSEDLLTGLRARTKPGRPDWKLALPRIIAEYQEERGTQQTVKPKLYACGPTQLCKDLKKHCSQLQITYKEEVFN